MSISERKLSYYCLNLESKDDKGNTINEFSKDKLKSFCSFIKTLDSKQKLINKKDANKTIELSYLGLYSKEGMDFLKGTIFAGKYNHSPDYMSKNDGKLRGSDKSMDEAFAEKTHLLGLIHTGWIEILFESRQAGASIGMVVQCLNHIWNMYPSHGNGKFTYAPISVDNLEEEIKRLTRIHIGTVHVDKNYFGEDDENFGGIEQNDAIQDELIISLKSKRNRSIGKKTCINLLRKAASNNSKIRRLRLEGKNSEGNTVIDTYLTKKINNVNVKLDNKGLVDDYSIFARMEEVFGIDE